MGDGGKTCDGLISHSGGKRIYIPSCKKPELSVACVAAYSSCTVLHYSELNCERELFIEEIKYKMFQLFTCASFLFGRQ